MSEEKQILRLRTFGASLRMTNQMRDEQISETAEVFDQYAALCSVAPEAGGIFVFYGELDAHGGATAVAANIAGAASLGVDADASRIKQAVRDGVCDFMVNGLDEALRILKNEIRKKEPVAVGVVGEPHAVVAEMLERGVQPDLVLAEREGAAEFVSRGARTLPVAVASPDCYVVTWSVTQDAAKWLPRVDALAIDALTNKSDGERDTRTRWLRLAPRYLRKDLQSERYVRMFPEELNRFVALLHERMQAGDIAVPVNVSSGGQPIALPHSSAAV